MSEDGLKVVKKITLDSHQKSTAWGRLMSDGSLEFELYDRDYMGGERADIYHMKPEHVDSFVARLSPLYVAKDIAVGADWFESMPLLFSSWYEFIPWFREQGIQFTHLVDMMP